MSGNDKSGFHQCVKCDSGTIQHTSFMNDDGVSSTHVYGCNRCENGWSEVDIPNPCKEFGGDSNLYMDVKGREERGTKSFPITDPLLIRKMKYSIMEKLDSLSPEEMENLQKILVESMKELREKKG